MITLNITLASKGALKRAGLLVETLKRAADENKFIKVKFPEPPAMIVEYYSTDGHKTSLVKLEDGHIKAAGPGFAEQIVKNVNYIDCTCGKIDLGESYQDDTLILCQHARAALYFYGGCGQYEQYLAAESEEESEHERTLFRTDHAQRESIH